MNLYGVPGALDTPTAHAPSDAEFYLSYANLEDMSHANMAFQISPRLTGVFRYSWLDDFRGFSVYYDRSFDLRYQLAEETSTTPAITVGLQDFGGTGIYAGEYVVATKTFGRLRASAGLGWGRYGERNAVENPLGIFSDRFRERPSRAGGVGRVEATHWFRGDMAPFGSLQYLLTDDVLLNLEYSPDEYSSEQEEGVFTPESPINVGLQYRLDNGIVLGASYLYGSLLSANVGFTLNAKSPGAVSGGTGGAPLPVAVRPKGVLRDLGWSADPAQTDDLRARISTSLQDEGLGVDAISVSADRIAVRFRNGRYVSGAQAIGRAARVLTHVAPDSVEVFVLEPVSSSGLSASQVTLKRSDLEDLAYDPEASWKSFARAQIDDVGPIAGYTLAEGRFPRLTYGVSPYLSSSYFDPAEPIRLDVGLQLSGRAEPVPGLVLSGAVRHKLLGNRGSLPDSTSVLPPVRTDGYRYAQTETRLSNLQGAYYFHPSEDVFARVSVGYFEAMFAGISSEVLWKPVDSRLAFGVELNRVQQRDYDQRLDLQDYAVTTGHVSAYYEAENGYYYQVDAGRYLAGDWGTTLTVDREFDNGVRVGAFATLTDVSADDFGEGSFDKGMRFTIPVSALSGRQTQRSISRTVRPVQRDGGARLSIQGRLYGQVRAFHEEKLEGNWGRFWR